MGKWGNHLRFKRDERKLYVGVLELHTWEAAGSKGTGELLRAKLP